MKDFKPFQYRAGDCVEDRKASYRTKLNVSYDFGPMDHVNYKHNKPNKLYCEILGRKYCQTCNEETLREASFVKSLTEAESVIASSATPSRTASTLKSRQELTCEDNESLIEEDRVDNIINHVFPIMYESLSLSPKIKRNLSMATSRYTSKHRPKSLASSSLSIESFDSMEDFGDDDERPNISRKKSQKYGDDASNVELYDQENNSISNKECFPKILGSNDKSIREIRHEGRISINEEMTEEEEDKEDLNLQELIREAPSKSFQKLVRRSSVVGRSLRSQSKEKLEMKIAKWTPTITEDYPRARRKFQRSGNFAKQKRETAAKKFQAIQEKTLMTSYLERKKQPKIVESILPMEPVECGMKYIKNRWKDEAMYKNNYFAIKLNISNKSNEEGDLHSINEGITRSEMIEASQTE